MLSSIVSDRNHRLVRPGTPLGGLDVSLDGGLTWQSDLGIPRQGFTAQGGVVTDRRGNVIAVTVGVFPLPEPDNPNRRVRGSLTITGGVLNASVAVAVL